MSTKEKVATVFHAAAVASGAAAGFTYAAGIGLAVLAGGLVLFGLALERS